MHVGVMGLYLCQGCQLQIKQRGVETITECSVQSQGWIDFWWCGFTARHAASLMRSQVNRSIKHRTGGDGRCKLTNPCGETLYQFNGTSLLEPMGRMLIIQKGDCEHLTTQQSNAIDRQCGQ